MAVTQKSQDTFPSISIVIPTLNSERVLYDCLASIAAQNYPKGKAEIIIADGGSTDKTLEIIKSFNSPAIKVVLNKLKTGEAGKAAGLKHATGEIVAFVDSDNILPDENWLRRMVEPFQDNEIIASEPWEYTYRRNDSHITRYCALLGMNDPLCLFLGNYDRHSILTGKWTEMPFISEDKGNYLKITLDPEYLPTIGANGFLIRMGIFEEHSVGDYLFDIDVIYSLLESMSSSSHTSTRLAKVKIGIVHLFSGDIKTFARKQRRRIRDYIYYNHIGARRYPWRNINVLGLIRFVLSNLFVIPLLIQSISGFVRKPDMAWFFHPIACWLTFWEYSRGKIGSLFFLNIMERRNWKQ